MPQAPTPKSLQEQLKDCKTAEEVFRAARRLDPDRFKDLADAHPISTPDDDYRHATGWRRPHRKTSNVTRHVAKSERRIFTDAEWAEAAEAMRAGKREWNLDYALAKEIADEGMRLH